MKYFITTSLFFFLTLSIFIVNGQTSDTAMTNLLVYGDNFMFSVNEPHGWKGDIDNAAKYYSNIIFYKSQTDLDNGGALIQIYNFEKKDEKTEKDLAYDINEYKNKYKNLKQQELIISHKEYNCYSKTVYSDNEFYQYIVYVNPGTKYKIGLSVAMNTSKRPATEDELNAFRNIIASLIMLKG
jgi:hypothetical protein